MVRPAYGATGVWCGRLMARPGDPTPGPSRCSGRHIFRSLLDSTELTPRLTAPAEQGDIFAEHRRSTGTLLLRHVAEFLSALDSSI